MGDMIQRLTTVAEDYFDCDWGIERAFFTIPQVTGGDLNVVYVTYSVRGPHLGALEQYMIDEVLHPLMVSGGERLYWRLRDRFHVDLQCDGLYMLRTRIAVLDKHLKPVIIDGAWIPEGQPAKVLP